MPGTEKIGLGNQAFYYMAPVFVILVSPVLLHETLTARKVVCVLLALPGDDVRQRYFENGLSGITDLSESFCAWCSGILCFCYRVQ